MVRKDDIDWTKKRVNIHTLKNPSDPYRSVRFFPENEPSLLNTIRHRGEIVNIPGLWVFDGIKEPRKKVWRVSHAVFGCTTHSFRHTNATLFCRAVRPSLHELMSRYGWKDPKPALIYIKYAFDETLDEKINEFYQKGGKL